MAHAQGRDSHGVAMQQQDGALVPDLDTFDHLPRTSYRTAIAMLLGLRRDADAAKLADENMMVGNAIYLRLFSVDLRHQVLVVSQFFFRLSSLFKLFQ